MTVFSNNPLFALFLIDTPGAISGIQHQLINQVLIQLLHHCCSHGTPS